MKPRNLFVIIAREASVDANDKMLSLVKIIERFTLNYKAEELAKNGLVLGKDVINFNIPHTVATSWYLGEKTTKATSLSVRLQVVDPHGKSLGDITQTHTVPAGIDRLNMNFNTNGIPIAGAGIYELKAELSKDQDVLASGQTPFVADLQEAA